MNTSEKTDSPKCPKCRINDHVISEFHKLIKKTDELNAQIAAINIEISNLKVQPVAIIRVLQKEMADVFVKNCKKCGFSAPKKNTFYFILKTSTDMRSSVLTLF